MASTYYDSAGKSVVAGDIAYAADLNDINNAVDSAFQQVEVAITGLGSNQSYYANIAEAWAANPQGVEVEPGRYSAYHYSLVADADATQTAADRVQTGLDRASASSSASTASGAANSATVSANTATGAANTATAQAIIATDQAAIATAAAAVFKPTPVGSIVAFCGGYFTNGSNGGFVNVRGNTVATANAACNPDGWYVCDGSALNLAGSPIFNGAGRYLPNLTDSRFILGYTSAGSVGGSNSFDHTHTTIDHSHTFDHIHYDEHLHATGDFTLTTSHIPSHQHTYYGWLRNANSSLGVDDSGSPTTRATDATGGGAAHNHGNTGYKNTGAYTYSITQTYGYSVPTSGASVTGTYGSSNTENRPLFLSCIYIMRAI